jgi:NADPH:quinone reductase
MSVAEIERALQSKNLEHQFEFLQEWFGFSENCKNSEELYAAITETWSDSHFLWLLAKLASIGISWAKDTRELLLENVEVIPDVFEALKELRYVELHGDFQIIPESIGCLRYLLSLKLKGGFSSLPSSLGRLQYLCQIELTTYQLEYIPDSTLWFFSHPDVECRVYTSSLHDASANKMMAVVHHEAGNVDVLEYRQVIAPSIGPHSIRVKVWGIGVNRADILERRGFYPPPFGARKEILGLEYSGEVIEVGAEVREWKIGDRVMGITAGGAYAEQIVVHSQEALPIPKDIDIVNAAAIPEAFLTAYDALFIQLNVQAGDRVLIHAIGSGVGNAGLQLCAATGATVIGTSRTQEKIDRAKQIGLEEGILVRDGEFAQSLTQKVDKIIDFVGAAYWNENITALRHHGEMIVVGLLGGANAKVNLSKLMQKRLKVSGTVLRSRTLDEKMDLIKRFKKQILPLFEQHKLHPTVDAVFPLNEVAKAHVFMESNRSYGKIILRVDN